MYAGFRSLSGCKDKTDTIRAGDGPLNTSAIGYEAAEGNHHACADAAHCEALTPLRPQTMLLADSVISRADENRC
ncbi:MAG: hypothetical protein P8R54_00945 [Myxococcota bacterium]|nr:hypothetical protein [Myxococcota bacterium]